MPALLAELPGSTRATPWLLELFPFKLKVLVISQICEAGSSHAATSSFKAVLGAPNVITDLTDRLYSCPAASPDERRHEAGTARLSCKGQSSAPAAQTASGTLGPKPWTFPKAGILPGG